MNVLLSALSIIIFSVSDVIVDLERQLDLGFNESLYQRYIYYCRQQNEGARLANKSEYWFESYSGHESLRAGHAEGLLMTGREREGFKEFQELYRDSPAWVSDIIFVLDDLKNEEVAWFIFEERKRTGNQTLHSQMLFDLYLRKNEDKKALSELSSALAAGASPGTFGRGIDILAKRLGTEKVLGAIKDAPVLILFQLALELGDAKTLEEAVSKATDKRDLFMMGKLSEDEGYLKEALLAYQKAGSNADAARVMLVLGRKDEALQLLEKDDSRKGMEQRAILYSGSSRTYAQALDMFKELERRYGARPEWITRICVLEFLCGHERKAADRLAGLPLDSTALLVKGVIAAAQGETDTLKGLVDISLVRFSGNAFENDLLLLYEIALTKSEGLSQYAWVLAAYHWGDPEDAYARAIELTEKNEQLADEAILIAAESLVRMGKWSEAEAIYSKLSRNYAASPLSPRADFERALLLRDHMDDPEHARELLESIILRNPTSLYADLARREM